MVGKTISHYKILSKLSEGGMGVVYKAEDTKLKRTVALKFLPPEMTRDKDAKKRFIQEAQAASAIEHTNICNIYEIDETEDGKLFISMAYYEGESLKKKIESERLLPIDQILDITLQIAKGLTIAHDSNIIHRDLKPANIMITDRGEVKIVDFGLAKLAGRTKLTKTGSTLGTVAYMSPEQTRGEKVDHRSDIWQLGVILHEMITGQLPFKGDYDQAVMYAITNENPEPLTGLRSGISLELERIVDRALAKDPKDRYQHADDLLSELNRFKKESDSDKKFIKTTPEKKKKNVVVLPAIILSTVIMIIAGYFLLKPSLPEKGELPASEWENSIAVLPFADLSPEKDQEYFCDGMTEQIITNISKIDRLKVIARTSVMTYKNTNKQIPEIGNELNVSHILEGSIRKHGNSIRVTAQLINTQDGSHLWADDFDRRLEHVFDVQDDVSEAIASNLLVVLSPEEKEDIKTNRPSNTEAYEHYMRGRHFHIQYVMTPNQDNFNKTEMLLKRAIELDPNYAPSYAELADLYNTYYWGIAHDEDEKNKYLDLQEKYIKLAYNLYPNSAEIYAIMVYIEEAKGEIEKAYQSLKKAILIQPNLYNLHHAIAFFYTRRGLEHLAVRFRSKQIELNPLDTPAYSQRFWLFIKLGEYEKADIAMQKLLEFNPGRPWAFTQYAYVLIVLKKYEEAEQIIARQEQLFPESAESLASRAFLLAAKGDKDKALEIDIGSDFYKHRLYQLLKMKDEIINYLNRDFEHLREIKGSWYLELMNSPAYEFLHSDPRFQEILAKHKEIYDENLRKYGDID